MKKNLLATLVASTLAALPAHADEADLVKRMERLSQELEAIKAELAQMKREKAAAPAPAPAPALPVATPSTVDIARAMGSAARVYEEIAKTTFFGYGELNYNRPRKDSSASVADARRIVLGFEHQFDAKTRMATEIEFEHAVTSASDPGETEIEQAYIEHTFAPGLTAKAGLFLIPMGLLNEKHEPTTYYGVERNFVETAIIPSTWREGGVQVHANTESGVSWDLGVTTGFDLSKWDAASSEGRESPLGSIHQELALAKGKDLSAFGALNYRGIPGFLVGGAIFSGKAAQGTADFPAQNARVTIWDAHARWTPGSFDLSAVYARGHISDTAAFNLTLVGNPSLVPEEFYGWYVQGAYHLWRSGEMAFTPFMRYERFNTASKFASLPEGLGPDATPAEKVWTGGFNFYLNPNVVFKADYQKFKLDSTRDRFDLGVGYQF